MSTARNPSYYRSYCYTAIQCKTITRVVRYHTPSDTFRGWRSPQLGESRCRATVNRKPPAGRSKAAVLVMSAPLGLEKTGSEINLRVCVRPIIRVIW